MVNWAIITVSFRSSSMVFRFSSKKISAGRLVFEGEDTTMVYLYPKVSNVYLSLPFSKSYDIAFIYPRQCRWMSQNVQIRLLSHSQSNHMIPTVTLLRSHSWIMSITILLLTISCSSPALYKEQILQTHQSRLKELKQAFGWGSIIGLHRLDQTVMSFGGVDSAAIVIPFDKMIGTLTITESGIYMKSNPELAIFENDRRITNELLRDDAHPDGATICQLSNLQWHVIKRQDQYYLRVKDSLSAFRQALDTIAYYPINKKYCVKAKVIPPMAQDSVRYLNELSQTFIVPSVGTLHFELEGKSYKISLLKNDSSTYFLIVGDNTNGQGSYGGGRYLYPSNADKTGHTMVDFNLLINPPCVFTPYATCPLPPKENVLDISILAGEKYISLF